MESIKIVDEKTYPMVADWWDRHNFPVLPYEMLPKKHGFIAYSSGIPSVAGFLYLPRSEDIKVAWTCWFVKNPAVPPEDVTNGFKTLNDHIEGICKELGLNACFTFTGIEALENRLEDVGYMKIEPGHMMLNVFQVGVK